MKPFGLSAALSERGARCQRHTNHDGCDGTKTSSPTTHTVSFDIDEQSYCTFIQVLVKVFLGYEAGVAKAAAAAGPAIFGQLVSERVKGVLVLELWPVDFPLNTRASTSQRPLHTLWHPRVSAFSETQFGISGMERLPAGKAFRWVAQRWLCEPKVYQDVLNELRAAERLRPRELRGGAR